MAPREIDFPYYNLTDGYQSTLFLVSDSPNPVDLTLGIRNLHGEMLTTSDTIQPQQKLAINLASRIAKLGGDPSGTYAEGSVAVYFVGTIMPVVGQMTVSNPALSLTHQVDMVENDPGRSDIPVALNGVWWGLGGGNQVQVMVSNTSDSVQMATVYLDFQGKRHALKALLTFAPYETKVLNITQLLASLGVDPAEAPEGGITIIQAGPNPALIASGKITDPATGFSSTIDFPAPDVQITNVLHAIGLPIGTPTKDSPFAGAGNFVPHVVVRNLISTPQTLTITVEYPVAAVSGQSANATAAPAAAHPGGPSAPAKGKIIPAPPYPGDSNNHPEWGAGTGSTTGSMRIASFPVAAYTTEDYSLAAAMNQLPLPLPFCSIRIQYSGAPGSMEAEVSSVETSSNMVVDARAENEGNGWAGSGANPWHLDKDTDSVLFLTNMSDKPARIGFEMTANGVHYVLTQLKLNPHETRAINLRALRDAQIADLKTNKLPAAATDGAVNWIRLDDVPVMGRIMVINRHAGTASSYDCTPCTCPASLYSGSMTPLPADFTCAPGEAMQCTITAQYVSCNGNTHYSYNETNAAIWSSNNSAVATMDGSVKGLMHAIAVGTAGIHASYGGNTYKFYPTPQPHCTQTSKSINPGTTVSVTNSACGDQRDEIIPQYSSYPTTPPFLPTCNDFTTCPPTGACATNFTFAELDVSQQYPWAILRANFLSGLQNTRNAYGVMTVNSAYREPAENHSIGGASSSQHVFGEAADIASTQSTWPSLAHDANQNSACVEPPADQGGSYAHVHMDWRGTCPPGWTGF